MLSSTGYIHTGRKLLESRRRPWKVMERERSVRKRMEVSGKREISPSISKQEGQSGPELRTETVRERDEIGRRELSKRGSPWQLWVVAGGLLIRFEGRFSLFCLQGCLHIVATGSWLKPSHIAKQVASSLLLAAPLIRDWHCTRGLWSRSRCCSHIVAFFGIIWHNLFKVHMSDNNWKQKIEDHIPWDLWQGIEALSLAVVTFCWVQFSSMKHAAALFLAASFCCACFFSSFLLFFTSFSPWMTAGSLQTCNTFSASILGHCMVFFALVQGQGVSGLGLGLSSNSH